MKVALKYRDAIIEVLFEINFYGNQNMAIRLFSRDEYGFGFTPFCNLTVNLDMACDKYCAFVNTNLDGIDIPGFLLGNEFATPTGRIIRSGYVDYPEYRFDAAVLRVLDREGYDGYCRMFEEEQEAS